MEETMSTVEARDQFGELINRAAFGKERVILTRRGKALVAVVPVEDMRLLEELESLRESQEFQVAKEEWEREGGETHTLDEVVRDLGIKG